jgi:hypothetical protein
VRVAIRLLTGATLVFFIVAIAAAQHGEKARATLPAQYFPGLFEALVVVALLALTILLFSIASILGLIVAIRAKERPWVIAIALSAAAVALIYLGLFTPNGFLLPVVRLLPLSSLGFWGFLLVFAPALLGELFLMVYSFRTVQDPDPPLYMRLGSGKTD